MIPGLPPRVRVREQQQRMVTHNDWLVKNGLGV